MFPGLNSLIESILFLVVGVAVAVGGGALLAAQLGAPVSLGIGAGALVWFAVTTVLNNRGKPG